MGFKRVIYQMKGNILLFPLIEDRSIMNVNRQKYKLKTYFSLLFFEPRFLIFYHTYNFVTSRPYSKGSFGGNRVSDILFMS